MAKRQKPRGRAAASGRRPDGPSRREFLAGCGLWTSAGFIAAPWRQLGAWPALPAASAVAQLPPLDDRLIPHYREVPPLEETLRQVEPGGDAFVTEKYAAEIEAVLAVWSAELARPRPEFGALEASLT
ncbi:MAG TPA: hypothetical protein VKU44_12005, partial [Terriglobia bacterium]|nr:hypothetical protein [Terriglobia bacterium]